MRNFTLQSVGVSEAVWKVELNRLLHNPDI